MRLYAHLRDPDRADNEGKSVGLEVDTRDPALVRLREDLELDAEAGRIGWHEVGDRLAAARAARSAFPLAVAA